MSEKGTLALAIIADDLTGALDAAAPFAGRGLDVAFALGAEHLPAALALRPDIIAVTTAGREISADAAAGRMRRVVDALPPVRIFKKIDSRLKGNIAAEISVLDFNSALMAPAIPEFGRVVRDGHVQGFGVDIPIPVVACLGPNATRSTIPDVASVAQMQAVLAASQDDLLIGARGLADALARHLTRRDMVPRVALPGPRGLFLVGSTDPITLDQVADLRSRPGIAHVAAPNGAAGQLPDAFRIILQALPGDVPTSGDVVAANLARAAAPLLRPGFGTVLLTGGASAEAVIRYLGIGILRLRGECLPGLVVAEAEGLTFVTKSGGFGERECLAHVAAMIGESACALK
ncbi:four-carbon acid sugar kinase family protein [Paracoccus laeviglucosivorans]|uniref:Uncharacterized conserved protein YgbK, DUF1537 family n=1 Tax=Paracoccus laeviglucosivorans TaxID=1197861 RepID=A0A521CAM6_9RHOB|nr:four-carbon acid sugar kinase family protein [Paracoccus laeviglucosivorans]SMO55861.1 Uncharacterized conserved protein YgbK, DUF1537 family [Paracoccus laeviglucosivorans]